MFVMLSLNLATHTLLENWYLFESDELPHVQFQNMLCSWVGCVTVLATFAIIK